MKKTRKGTWIMLALATFCLLGSAVTAQTPAAQSKQTAAETYTWNGELVSLDEGTRMLTVKAWVAGEQAPAELGKLKAGDRILLSWSAFDKYANAVNGVAKFDPAKKSEERYAFPVEFVSYDSAHQYVTFKTQIPADAMAKIKPLKPGEWVTATSPQGKASEAQPIVAIRPYVSSSSSSN